MKTPRAKLRPVERYVHPAHGVFDVFTLVGEVEELVDAVELDAFVVDLAGDDGLEAKRRPRDQACESKTADGRSVEVGIFSWRAQFAGAVGADELELGDVAAEGPGGVMVFPVDVVGYCSTQGYIFCSGRNGQKKAAGDSEVKNLREGDSALCGEEAGLGIEVDQAIHAGGQKEVAVFEEADVAVAAAHTDGERSIVQAGCNGGKVALPVERDDLRAVGWVAAPGFKGGRA